MASHVRKEMELLNTDLGEISQKVGQNLKARIRILYHHSAKLSQVTPCDEKSGLNFDFL